LPKCTYEYEPGVLADYPPEIPLDCKEHSTENSRFCIFHDKSYYIEHEQEAAKGFEEKVRKCITQNKPLVCFGYYLPGISFASLLEGKSFSQPVYFNKVTFTKDANFWKAKFSKKANFDGATFMEGAIFVGAKFTEEANFVAATFSKEAYFGDAKFTELTYFGIAKFLGEVQFRQNEFTGKTFFRNVTFEQQNKVKFDENDLSNVSFADTDITRIRLGDGIRWGGDDKFTLIEEKWLENKTKDMKVEPTEDVTLELVLSVYRNLRENYEFRLRYDDAGKFFIKEMELKRKYREIITENLVENKKNGWFRRNVSLTGLYYHPSRYGESISRPTLIGAITVILSTLFWLTQSNPILEPHFYPSAEPDITSSFIGFAQVGNGTQWLKSFERSFADFLPLLSLGGDIKVGVIDYIIKIVGGALTFGLLLIAFRRKFERKYTR